MGLTEGHWFEDEEPELTEKQLEDILWENNKIFERGYQKGFSDGKSAVLREQEHARWILDRLHHYKCSACGAQWGLAPLNMNYCPTCGRYMEECDPDDCRYAQDAEEDEE